MTAPRKCDMKCPKCDGELNCPCEHCSSWNEGKPKYIWTDGETIECCHCGFKANANYWSDWDISGVWPTGEPVV